MPAARMKLWQASQYWSPMALAPQEPHSYTVTARLAPLGGRGASGAAPPCRLRHAATLHLSEQWRRRPEGWKRAPHTAQVIVVTPSLRGGVSVATAPVPLECSQGAALWGRLGQ